MSKKYMTQVSKSQPTAGGSLPASSQGTKIDVKGSSAGTHKAHHSGTSGSK